MLDISAAPASLCSAACCVLSLLRAGKYSVVMDSDAWHFGGKGRVAWDGEHFTTPATEEEGGKFNDRDQYFQVSEGTVCGGARVQGCQVCVLGGGEVQG